VFIVCSTLPHSTLLQGWESTGQEHLPSPFPLHGPLHRAEQRVPRAREIQHAFEGFEAVGEGVVRDGEEDTDAEFILSGTGAIVLDTPRTLLDACLYALSSRNTTLSRLMAAWACLLLDRFLITSYRKGDLTK
jgi:hypothetical protein